MSLMSITPAQVAAGEFPNCRAVTVHICGDDIKVELHMTGDDCAVPFANVVQCMPELVERFRAEIHAAGGSMYLPLQCADYVDYDAPEPEEIVVVVQCSARGVTH